MKYLFAIFMACAALSANASGFATCDSGDKAQWQPKEKLEKQLKDEGYDVRRIKEDGGCYEVYATNKDGKRGEFVFHPVTLKFVAQKLWN